MAKQTNSATIPQDYPRIQDDKSHDFGCLDVSQLVEHERSVELDELKELIRNAIQNASKKSSREIISLPANATTKELEEIYAKEGHGLFA